MSSASLLSVLCQSVNQSYKAAVTVTWLIKLEPTECFTDLTLTPVSRPTWKVTMFTAINGLNKMSKDNRGNRKSPVTVNKRSKAQLLVCDL